MKIPNKIKIGSHWVDIKKVSNKDISNVAPGDFDYINSLIRINTSGFNQDRQDETLLHEIIEAIKAFNSLEIQHKDLTVLSEGLLQVIRHNNLNFAETE